MEIGIRRSRKKEEEDDEARATQNKSNQNMRLTPAYNLLSLIPLLRYASNRMRIAIQNRIMYYMYPIGLHARNS